MDNSEIPEEVVEIFAKVFDDFFAMTSEAYYRKIAELEKDQIVLTE